MGRRKKYNTEEERLAAKREASKRYRENNPDRNREYQKRWREKNPDKAKANIKRWQENNDWNGYMAKYIAKSRLKQNGRAKYMVDNYKRLDKKYNRGECTLTPEWVVENIFNQPCHYCGETDWHKLGCDRIYNDLPHTPENVVCCCAACNYKKHRTPYDEYMRRIGKIA